MEAWEPNAARRLHVEHQRGDHDIGPTMMEFLGTCWEINPGQMVFFLSTSGFSFLVVCGIVLCHRRRLIAAPLCLRRHIYLKILYAPVVLGGSALLDLLSPSSYYLCLLIQKCYEAYTLYSFGMLLFILLWRESHAFLEGCQSDPENGADVVLEADVSQTHSRAVESDAATPQVAASQTHSRTAVSDAASRKVDVSEIRGRTVVSLSDAASPKAGSTDEVVAALAAQGPRKHFGVPPLGCCLWPCLRRHDLSVRHLHIIFLMIRQYIAVIPVCGVLASFLKTSFSSEVFVKAARVPQRVGMASSLICIYGLIVVYKSTHELLHHWNTTRKFVAMKLTLILMVWQEFLLHTFGAPHLTRLQQPCFKKIGFIDHGPEVEAQYWTNWLLSLEMMLMAWMLTRAFPAQEIHQRFPEVHHDILDMAIQEDVRGKLATSDAEDASGQEENSGSSSENA